MKIALGHVLTVILIVLAGARPAVAADADAPVVDALLRFIDALESGDAKALEQSIAAESIVQERCRRTFVGLCSAQKALEKTALKQFGEEGKMFRCGFELIVNSADRRMIASAKVFYDEPMRAARIEKPGELAPMWLRRTQDNQWQVVLEHIELEDESERYPPGWPQPGAARQAAQAAIKATHNSAMIEAFRATQARIESGDLSSATAAHAELMSKLATASADATKARAAIPSGRPKERP